MTIFLSCSSDTPKITRNLTGNEIALNCMIRTGLEKSFKMKIVCCIYRKSLNSNPSLNCVDQSNTCPEAPFQAVIAVREYPLFSIRIVPSSYLVINPLLFKIGGY